MSPGLFATILNVIILALYACIPRVHKKRHHRIAPLSVAYAIMFRGAVMFVRDLDKSLEFYRVLGLVPSMVAENTFARFGKWNDEFKII